MRYQHFNGGSGGRGSGASSGSSIWSYPSSNSAAPAPVVHAGLTAENVAEKFHVEREVQDRCAAASHAKAAAAQVQGRFPGWL